VEARVTFFNHSVVNL